MSNILYLPEPSNNNLNYGVNIAAFETFTLIELQRIKDFGFNHIRVTIQWRNHEFIAPGTYTFNAGGYNLDSFMSMLDTVGLKAILLVFSGNTFYANSIELAKGFNVSISHIYGINTEQMRVGYANFFNALVTRYSGKGHMFEVWNEPNLETFWTYTGVNVDEYYKLARTTGHLLRMNHPNEILLLGALSPVSQTSGLGRLSFDPVWIEKICSPELIHLYDALAIHPYRYFDFPESILPDLEYINSVIQRNISPGRTFRIVCDETGYTGSYFAGQFLPSSYEATGSVAGTRNLLIRSNDLSNNAWFGWYLKPSVTSGFLDPLGGSSAFRLSTRDFIGQPNGAGKNGSGLCQYGALTTGEQYTYSVWLRADAPMEMSFGASEFRTQQFRRIQLTTEWQRFHYTFQIAAQDNFGDGARIWSMNEQIENNPNWYMFGPQVELVTATTEQKKTALHETMAEYDWRLHDTMMGTGYVALNTKFSWIDASVGVETTMGVLNIDGTIKLAYADKLASFVPWNIVKTNPDGSVIP